MRAPYEQLVRGSTFIAAKWVHLEGGQVSRLKSVRRKHFMG